MELFDQTLLEKFLIIWKKTKGKLLDEKELSAVYQLRQILSEREDATDSLLEMLKKSKNNADFLVKLQAWIKLYKK